MNRLINFVKIQATGNDFVICKADSLSSGTLSPESIRKICHRQFGIGSDGLIIISADRSGKLHMQYFNSDGTEGEMCGNGLRASVLFAYVDGLIKANKWYSFEAADGTHRVRYHTTEKIQVEIIARGEPETIQSSELRVPENLEVWGFINTGVPHLVIEAKNKIEDIPVYELGRGCRYHVKFEPQGTNVNFVRVIGENKIKVRTYERGVEQETLSCGTGVTASALFYLNKFADREGNVAVETNGGLLEVARSDNHIYLTGPAKISFTGNYMLEDQQSENIKT